MNKKYLSLIPMAMLLVGCNQTPAPTTTQVADSSGSIKVTDTPMVLDGKAFTIKSFNGKAVEQSYTVSFKDGSVGAKLCNSMGGSYTLTGNEIKAETMSTMMFCEQPAGLQDMETALGKALNSGTKVTMNSDGSVMLKNTDSEFILAPASAAPTQSGKEISLDGTFIMKEFNGKVLTTDATYLMTFEEKTLHGNVCNNLSGDYAMTRGKLSVPLLVSTRMMCPESVMEVESALQKALKDGADVIKKDNTITINGSDGSTFMYETYLQ